MNTPRSPESEDRVQRAFDDDFDAFLRDDDSHIAKLYRKLPQSEPDAQLDARVRIHARRSVRGAVTTASPTTLPRARRRARWLSALGAAAAIVLVAGLVWRSAPHMWSSRESAAQPVQTNNPSLLSGQNTVATANDARSTSELPESAKSLSVDRRAQTMDAPAPSSLQNVAEEKAADTENGIAMVPSRVTAPAAVAQLPAPVAAATPADSVAVVSPQARAFPAAPEARSDKSGKVENAAPTSPTIALPMRPSPAGVNAAQAQSAIQTNRAKTAVIAICPTAPKKAFEQIDGLFFEGHYPPDIPWTSDKRIAIVRKLVRVGNVAEAQHAYQDLHAHCPQDTWPQELLDQIGSR